MWLRKKNRNRLIIVLVIALIFIFWRGLGAATKNDFKCEYKVLYAVCTPKKVNAKLPGIWDLFKAGIKF